MNPLALAKIEFQAVKQRIREQHPDLDEETLADTIEGLTSLPDIVEAIIRSVLTDEALAGGLRSRIEAMQARQRRLSERASARRGLARDVMVDAGLKKIAAPDFTASIRPGSPSLIVMDDAKVPADYWEPREPKLNREALLRDLKLQGSIPGVALANPQSVLTVRTQ
jgi:hypothetical protein